VAGLRAHILRVVLTAGMVVLVFFLSVGGVGVSMSRMVHDIFRGSEFGEPMAVEDLENLRWAQPTWMTGYEIREDEIARLHTYLKGRRKNFFVFPDFTIFYGLIGVPSPQPLLWFHEGLTYSKVANSELDRRIVEDLKRNQVQIFVREEVSWVNTVERLYDFPQMKSYLRSNFTKVGAIGIFSVYERKPPD
jgi:hypothetical protein